VSVPFVSVVIPTFRRPDALRETLTGLAGLEWPADRHEVIVVDDGSGDETERVVEGFAEHRPMRFVAQENAGAAAARNHGARVARGDLLLFLDDDVLVKPDHLLRHTATHARHARSLVASFWEFAPAVVDELRRSPFGRYRLALHERFSSPTVLEVLEDGLLSCQTVSSQDLSLDRELFQELGGFDESFPAAGAEDQELSYRAIAADCTLISDPEIRVLHNDSRVTLEAFCRREERSAGSVVVLAVRFPQSAAAIEYRRVNGSLGRHDSPAAATRKLFKVLASRPAGLRLGHGTIRALEALGAPESVLRRAYSGLAGLYIFRGFRRAAVPSGRAADHLHVRV
jgi:GT2 family glycosyltransferase